VDEILIRKLEARILRALAEALDEGYDPGYHGRGGPQDGDDEPPSFNVKAAIRSLTADAVAADNEAARLLGRTPGG